jgi:hypothetical protein
MSMYDNNPYRGQDVLRVVSRAGHVICEWPCKQIAPSASGISSGVANGDGGKTKICQSTCDRVASFCELVSRAEMVNALRVVCDFHRRTGPLSASWCLEQKKLLSCAHFVIINFCHHK